VARLLRRACCTYAEQFEQVVELAMDVPHHVYRPTHLHKICLLHQNLYCLTAQLTKSGLADWLTLQQPANNVLTIHITITTEILLNPAKTLPQSSHKNTPTYS
jgi:hypothetical protein